MSSRNKISLILNLLIVVFEIVGFIYYYSDIGILLDIKYFTELTNFLALISCLFYSFSLALNGKVNNFIKKLKYYSTYCLLLTILVVIFVLVPTTGCGFKLLLFSSYFLFQHFLCPILSIITFLFFDDIQEVSLKTRIKAVSIPLIYGFICMCLNVLGLLDGPYPFFRINNLTLTSALFGPVILFFIIFVVNYVFDIVKDFVYYNIVNKKTT